MIKYVLFDMDGTLVDSANMVIARYVETFEHFGIAIPGDQELHGLVGPSAFMSMTKYLGDEKANLGITFYRKLAQRDGMKGLNLFAGIQEMLDSLCETELILGVATSKPEHEAVKILQHLQMEQYFQVVSGASDKSGINTKSQVIVAALDRLGNPMSNQVAMVGDRIFDIEAASALNIKSIFVEWGGASLTEASHATQIVSKPDQILPTVCQISTDEN